MKRVYDLRRLDNVFVAIVLLCLISNLSTHVFWRIESSLANCAAFLAARRAESTSSLLRLEKYAPRTGFGEMAQTARSNRHASRRNGESSSIVVKVIPYV
jgi:hypothetical protein